MKKKLLAFGSLAMIATPIATVVACSEEKSEVEKELDKITNEVKSSLSGATIKTNIAAIAENGKVEADKLGIDNKTFKLSEGYDVEYTLVAKGDTYQGGTNTLEVMANVFKTADKENTHKDKKITIKPFEDKEDPKIQAKTDVEIGNAKAKIVNDADGKKGTLALKSNDGELATIKTAIEGAFVVTDDQSAAITPTIKGWEPELKMEAGTYVLTVEAKDLADKTATYTLTVTITAA